MHISFVKIKNYRGIKADQFEASPFTCAIGVENEQKTLGFTHKKLYHDKERHLCVAEIIF